MFKSTKSLLLITSLVLPLSLYAVESNTTIVSPTVEENTSLSLANELLKTMHMEKTYEGMIANITQIQIQRNQKLKMIEPTIHAFFDKYMGWEALKDDMATMYAKRYSSEELAEVIAFYKTEVGQKTLAFMPEIAIKGTEIAQKKLSAHIGELKEMVEAEMKKLVEDKK